MDTRQYTDYKILKIIEGKSDISQRLISKQTGLNVSSVNFAIKRLIQRGHVKVTNMNKKRILYHLTPNGISQKAKLAYNFFLTNYNLFTDIRAMVLLRLDEHTDLEGKNIALFGVNEIAEIIYFCFKEKEVNFAGIYEDKVDLIGSRWLGEPVKSLDDIKNNGHIDYIIDAKAVASNILGFSILTFDDFIDRQSQHKNIKISFFNKTPKFSIEFCGAKNTVTGSSILLRNGDKNILVDCGISQGQKEDPEKNNSFLFNPEEINYLFLTHAHIDHSGKIPQLIDKGFKGEILCHHATIDILPVLLKDSLKLNGRIKYGLTHEQLMARVTDLSWGFEYNRWNQISKNLRFRFLDAGHILGSASIQIDLDGEYIVFSGDIGNQNTGIICDPVVPDRADILIMESTYGGRNHSNGSSKNRFKKIIKKALQDNGKVLIPAFAVGRTQEIIYQLNDMVEKGEIENIPVFVDSPMGIRITEIYEKHKDCFDEETLQRLVAKDDPLEFEKLFAVEHYRDSVKIDSLDGAAIIIAGSGMCSGGRIVNHIVNLIEDKTTDIIFVGYQVEGTTGSEILKYSGRKNGYIIINGEKAYINAEIHQISGFSAHADHNGLMKWVEMIKQKPHTIYLNHGEPEAQANLKESLLDKFKNINIISGE